MTEFTALRPKTCSYLTNDNNENIKAKGTKSAIKQKLNFEDYEATQPENKMSQLEKKEVWC